MKLSECLSSMCAVRASVGDVAEALQSCLARYGDVRRTACVGLESSLRHILPIASFPTRYLVAGAGNWVALLSNAKQTAANDQMWCVCSKLGCVGTFGLWSEHGRVWRVVDGDHDVRAITCIRRSPQSRRWEFHMEGRVMPFEDESAYTRSKVRERLPGVLVQSYLREMTGIPFPVDWPGLLGGTGVALTRSMKDGRVEIVDLDVDVDILPDADDK